MPRTAEDAELARREAQKAADAAQLALQKTIEELTTRDMERARRRRTADQRWSEGDTPGSTTARGRVYVREGEPDETTTVNGVETWLYKDTTKTPVTREYQFDAHGERIK